MNKTMQETQYHPSKKRRIRRITLFAGSSVSVGYANNINGEPDAILRVLIRTILRACIAGYQEAKRYCGYCIRNLTFVILFLTLLWISCCGYSTRSLLPDYFKKVHIRLFDNRTLKPGLDELATNAVIEAFRSGSNLRIADENSADIVIEGEVTRYSKDPFTYTGAQTVTEYKITVKFSIRCVDKVKNEVFWKGDVSDWATFASDEENAINEAIKKTADELVTKILTNW